MTAVNVNIGTEDQDAILGRLVQRGMEALGPMAVDLNPATGDLTLTWPSTLTANQIAAVQEAARAARTGLLTPAERSAIQSDIDGLIAYQALGSPTLVQTTNATKAQNRILRAILRS